MNKQMKQVILATAATAATAAIAGLSLPAYASETDTNEKCYGVALAGQCGFVCTNLCSAARRV
jgi:uncharacterized membrane protein